jgi:hypothetical protein
LPLLLFPYLQVHTDHSNVPLLAPTLTNCLATTLNSLSSSSSCGPLQFAAACFPGCVQLLANIFSLRPDSSSSSSGGDTHGGDGCDGVYDLAHKNDKVCEKEEVQCSSSSSSSGGAAALLSAVCGALVSLGEGSPAVEVTLGAAAVGATATAHPAAAEAAKPETVSNQAHQRNNQSNSYDRPELAAVTLQCCEPACLTAGKPQQQLTLQLQPQQQTKAVTALSGSSSSRRVRLVAFQDGAAVVDKEVSTEGSSIR